jgi:hypothetical protein
VATTVGIHVLVLKTGVSADEFAAVFNEEIFPAAAETPGSVNRGGRSTIGSQHLLKPAGGAADYLWLVKSSGVFDSNLFERVLGRMYDEALPKLEAFCERRSSVVYTQVNSYDAGPCDELGRPTGPPTHDIGL